MVTIYDSAVRSFEAAAAVLMSLQSCRTNLAAEAGRALDNRPKVILSAGYNSLTSSVGICMPEDARAEFSRSDDDDGLEFRTSGLNWMTIEGLVPAEIDAATCYLDAAVSFPAPTVADVFLRDFLADGGIADSLHQEWALGADRAAVCSLRLPALRSGATARRIIIHLRQPPLRFVIRSLSLTMV
ncbi:MULTISPECIES: hypothetical protein [Paracoccus]|uniref:hypothetical protein n=1 Tax=Paracoccus TaxID=265 RepID=UPI0008691D6C|nr:MULTISPECIES: hypothetical protein [Paracoccus]ODT61556.1 MAG: hypothetical protein ABS73_01275 [Paracoccus sp. SCN 68-21]